MLDSALKFFRCVTRRARRVPLEFQVELTNRCNLSCSMCLRKQKGVPDEDMDIRVFEKVISRMPDDCSLVLTGWGEPLMHPEFLRLIGIVNVRLPRARVRFTTNGLLLLPDMTDALLEKRIHRITVSVEKPLKEGAEDFRGHLSGKRLIDNLEYLTGSAGASASPEVMLQAVMLGEADITGTVELAHRLGISSVNIVRFDAGETGDRRPSFGEESEIISAAVEKGRELGVNVSCVNRQGLLVRTAVSRWCPRIDDSAYINSRGEMTPCCNLPVMSMGSMLEEPLEAVWSGRKFREFRSRWKKDCGKCDALMYRQGHRHIP